MIKTPNAYYNDNFKMKVAHTRLNNDTILLCNFYRKSVFLFGEGNKQQTYFKTSCLKECNFEILMKKKRSKSSLCIA